MTRVLVIDDEPDVRDVLRRVLERGGYEVATAVDSGSGLAACRQQTPDVVVTDIIMPPIGLITRSSDFVKTWGITLPVPGDGAAVVIKIGSFLDSVVQFLIVAFAIFLLVRAINKLRSSKAAAAPATRECPYCASAISVKATRCPCCTSQLTQG